MKKFHPGYVIVLLAILFTACSKEELFVSEELGSKTDENISFKATSFYESESNNTLATADGPVGTGTTINGEIGTSGDEDWFKINCTQSVSMSFLINGTTSYLTGYIYNSSGSLLGTINYNSRYVFTPLFTGNIYVKMIGYSVNSYTLDVISNEVPESENNNTAAQADGPIITGNYFTGAADGTTVFDFVKVTVSVAGPYTFYLDGSSQYLTADILNSSQQQIASISKGQAITYNNLAAGTYYIRIYGYSGVTYKFYANPDFSIVNSIYFQVLGSKPDYGVPFSSYKSSVSNFLPNEYIDLIHGWDKTRYYYYFLPAHVIYVGNYMYENKFYTNGFPILFWEAYTSIPENN